MQILQYCIYCITVCILYMYVLGCSDCFCGHVSLLHEVTKLNNVLQIWNKPAWMRACTQRLQYSTYDQIVFYIRSSLLERSWEEHSIGWD